MKSIYLCCTHSITLCMMLMMYDVLYKERCPSVGPSIIQRLTSDISCACIKTRNKSFCPVAFRYGKFSSFGRGCAAPFLFWAPPFLQTSIYGNAHIDSHLHTFTHIHEHTYDHTNVLLQQL